MNIKRTHSDVVGLVHEIGHAVANYATGKQPYPPLWGFPADFSEVPSGAMEMFSQPYWDEFYNTDDLQIARRQYFQGVLRGSLFVTGLDAFQHWVYRNPEAAHDLDNCDARWHDLMQRYLPGKDWNGIEKLNGIGWQTMSLNFYMPLHAMEYTYGLLAGLKLLTVPQHEALTRYKTAIALGNSASTKGLFAALGVEFPFTDADIIAAAQKLSAWV
jgi:oligoendopeptidase F